MTSNWFLFKTSRGWAGILGGSGLVKKSILPSPFPLDNLLNTIFPNDPKIQIISKQNHSQHMVNNFRAYFNGEIIKDWQLNLDLSSLPYFSRKVLKIAYTIPYGQTITYGELAREMGKPKASRAVGYALSQNPLPLIIPCHRIVAKNGLGGFSAPGGPSMKKEMLELEIAVLNKNNPG